jgi:polyhydroxyalkanoate synthesis repressor PhaR
MLRRRMLVVKKYANRRLYDTSQSRYITLEDLGTLIRGGTDVIVQDAHSGADLTQSTLTQIILEMRGGARLLPVPLLLRLIRLGDEALAEFFGRYVSWTLELYVQAKQGARSLFPLNPLAAAPFAATDALARMVMGASPFSREQREAVTAAPPPPSGAAPPVAPPSEPELPLDLHFPEPRGSGGDARVSGVEDEMARIRAELESLKRALGPRPRAATKKSRGAAKKKR